MLKTFISSSFFCQKLNSAVVKIEWTEAILKGILPHILGAVFWRHDTQTNDTLQRNNTT